VESNRRIDRALLLVAFVLVCAVVGIGLNLALSWRRVSQLVATVATDK
jgi:hypothetical protein